jgi:conjugal transfer mating pair stabilization protein TraN
MRGIAAAAWLAAGAATAGVTCGPVAWSCVEEVPGGTVGGVPVAAYCAAWEGFRTCIDDNPANECVAVGQSPRCEEISSECAVWNHGLCEQTRKEFECLNENGDMAPAVIFRTGFGDVEETIDDQCAALDADPACRYEDTRVIEGEEPAPSTGWISSAAGGGGRAIMSAMAAGRSWTIAAKSRTMPAAP